MKNKIILAIFLLPLSLFSQEILTLSNAVKITLENDYNIKVAENNALQAENNTSIFASGYLPSIQASGGSIYRSQNINTDFHDGSSTSISGSNSLGYNASINLNYTLFDGMYRSYNFEKSKALFNLSKLQVRLVIESTLLDLFSAYYQVANLSEITQNYKETLEISKVRLLRTTYGAEYGKNTQLAVLNAQVDVNTDSINYLNSIQNLANAKRNLNVFMGQEVGNDFIIDTTLNYETMANMPVILEKAFTENIRLLQVNLNHNLAEFDIKLLKTNYIPTLGLNGAYNWNQTDYNKKAQYDLQTISGPQAGLSLSWSIFDGGRTRVGIQNAKIASENIQVKIEQTKKQVERDVVNAYSTYQNALFVLKAEKENVVTNQSNFNRSKEQFELGHLSSVEFRQAQLNLLQSKSKYNMAKYQAKIYELALFKLSGDLLNLKF